MSLSVSSIRQDKLKSPGKGVKCGKGYISQGETCGGAKTKKAKKVSGVSKVLAGLSALEGTVRTVQGVNNIRKGNIVMGGAQLGTAVGHGLAARSYSKGENLKGLAHAVGTTTIGAIAGGAGGAGAQGIGNAIKNYKSTGRAYRELGVKPNASPEEIKKAWKKASRKAHPDMGGSTEKQQKVNAAYEAAMKKARGGKFKKDGKSVWAAGSKVTDGENFWEM
jgi:hypothetical protein